MRYPSMFQLFLIAIAVGAFVFFGFLYFPDLLNIVGGILMLGVLYFVIRANASLFTFSKNEVASGIYEIHMDKNETDFHVFSYHNSSRVKSGLSPLRIVQHHFFKARGGKKLYSKLFSHDVHAMKGTAGYDGFEIIEKSVLPCEELKQSLDEFSKKLDKTLSIGRKLEFNADDNLYPIEKGLGVRIEKNEQEIITRFSVLFMNSNTDNVLWKKKI